MLHLDRSMKLMANLVHIARLAAEPQVRDIPLYEKCSKPYYKRGRGERARDRPGAIDQQHRHPDAGACPSRQLLLMVETMSSGAHIETMTRLNEFLTAAEFDALEQVDEGRNHRIAYNLSERLLELGYIENTAGNLVITSAGQMRLALGV